MDRRLFLKCGAMATLATLAAPELMANQKAGRLPNILFIYADDMGYGDLGIQNPDSKIPTPHLDELARSGVRFTDGHSSSGICTPSRYALLTGRYHWRKFHRIVNSFEQYRISPDTLTMPEMLREAGYRTACIGKWHLGWDWNAVIRPEAQDKNRRRMDAGDFYWSRRIPGGPVDRGFDYYFGDDVINFPPYTWIENAHVQEEPKVPLDLSEYGDPPEAGWEHRPGPMVEGWNPYEVLPTLTEKTEEWIEQQGPDKPFFLYFSLPSPHTPIIPNEQFIGKSQAGPYGDFVYETDWSIGRVIQKLKELDLYDNTLIVFTSDNGPEVFAFERARRFDHFSMGDLRGIKTDIWEGGHRVPFLVSWPGVMEPGRVCDALVSQVDFMATFAAIVGYELPDDAAEDSYNLLDLWRDADDNRGPRTSHVHNTHGGRYAIRKGDWVLIDTDNPEGRRRLDWFEDKRGYEPLSSEGGLFCLKSDTRQGRDLIEEHPDKAAELRQALNDIREQGYSAPRLAER